MPKDEWQPPESGDAPEGVKEILKSAYSSCRDKWAEDHPDDIENKESKERCAKIAWAAVHKAGWSKDNEGKWNKETKENAMEDIKALIAQLTEMYSQTKEWKEGVQRNGEQKKFIQDIHDLAGEMGAKHKDGNCKALDSPVIHRAFMQNIHDHAVNLGADCGTVVKEESLDEKTQKIRNAFYDQFSKPTPSTSVWCQEIFEESIIVDAGEDGLFRIGYSINGEGEIVFNERDKWQQVEQEYVSVKADDLLVTVGTEVKAKENGRYGEFLLRFSNTNDPDVSGDFFDKSTDYGFVGTIKSPVYLHHCLPVKTKNGVRRITQAIGEAILTLTDDGVVIDAELYDWLAKSHDEYIAQIAGTVKAAIKASKMGWSSGTAPHLVQRTKVGNAYHIDKWPLGLDATITPRPAGIKQGVQVIEIKSINQAELDILETEAETVGGGASVVDQGKQSQKQKVQGEYTMNEEERKALLASLKADLAAEEAAKKAIEDKAKADKDAMKALVVEVVKELKGGKITNAGGVKTQTSGPGPNAQHDKTKYGDDAKKAWNYWLKTGDKEALRDLDAERENPDMLDPERINNAFKTAYPLVGDVEYEGLELVPLEVIRDIRELRDKDSLARQAGATVLPVGAVTNYVPIEKARTGKFVIQTAGTPTQGGAFDANTVELINRATLTVYDFTRTIPVSRQLLSDAVINIESWWNRHIARAEAATENYYFVSVGTGSNQPKAALVGSALGKTAAGQAAITASEIIALYHAVPQQYRNRLAIVMNGTTAGVVRGLAASYAFSFIPTPAGSLNGGSDNGGEWLIAPRCRMFEEDNMPAMTAGLKSVLIGNFEEYLIGDREAMSVLRDPFSGAANGNVNFHCFFRRGGTTWTDEAFKHLIQASG